MKTRLSQYLLPDMELLQKMFPKMLAMQNAKRAHNHFFLKIVRKTESPILISQLPKNAAEKFFADFVSSLQKILVFPSVFYIGFLVLHL